MEIGVFEILKFCSCLILEKYLFRLGAGAFCFALLLSWWLLARLAYQPYSRLFWSENLIFLERICWEIVEGIVQHIFGEFWIEITVNFGLIKGTIRCSEIRAVRPNLIESGVKVRWISGGGVAPGITGEHFVFVWCLIDLVRVIIGQDIDLSVCLDCCVNCWAILTSVACQEDNFDWCSTWDHSKGVGGLVFQFTLTDCQAFSSPFSLVCGEALGDLKPAEHRALVNEDLIAGADHRGGRSVPYSHIKLTFSSSLYLRPFGEPEAMPKFFLPV